MSSIKLESNASGTGIFTIASPNSNTNRTLTLPDNTGTILTTSSTIAGTGPAFSAYANADQSVSNNTNTKITFQVEDFDTASCFASSTFTPNVAGYYQINGILRGATTSGTLTGLIITLHKNGSAYARAQDGTGAVAQGQVCGSWLVYCNGTTDYLELYGIVISGATNSFSHNSAPITSRFSGSLVRAA